MDSNYVASIIFVTAIYVVYCTITLIRATISALLTNLGPGGTLTSSRKVASEDTVVVHSQVQTWKPNQPLRLTNNISHSRSTSDRNITYGGLSSKSPGYTGASTHHRTESTPSSLPGHYEWRQVGPQLRLMRSDGLGLCQTGSESYKHVEYIDLTRSP